MKNLIPFLFLFFFSSFTFASIDDVVLSPGKMGPRALPIKEVGPAAIKRYHYLSLSLVTSFHYEKELSLTPKVDIFLPWNRYVALTFKAHPVEYYDTDEETRIERNAAEKSGLATGDINFGALFHLFHNKKEEFDLFLNFETKTSSGNDLKNARHTQAPAYQIDISFNKKVNLFSNLFFMPDRFSGYTGFLTWPISRGRNDDAFAWGLKVTYGHPRDVTLELELGGYSGSRMTEDRPLSASTKLIKHFDKIDLFARYQYGLRDQIPHTMTFGIGYRAYIINF